MTINLHKIDAIAKRIPSGVTIPSEAHFLFDHVIKRAKKGVIEIGSWKGRSTIYLATAAKHRNIPMVAIDSWCDLNDSPDPKENNRDEWPEFCRNMEKAKLSYIDVITNPVLDGFDSVDIQCLKLLSKEALKYAKPTLRFSEFDFLFIDGDHEEKAVRWDFENWSAILSRPATVILHDVGAFPGPRKLFQYLVQFKKYDYKFINNMAAVYLE